MNPDQTAKVRPETALVLAIVFPGMGQFYNGQVGKGFLILLTSVIVIPWLWGIYDAFVCAKRVNSGELTPTRFGFGYAVLWSLAATAMVLIVVFLAAFGFVMLFPEMVEELNK